MSTTRLITTPVLVLVGPTAIGKTALSLEMADRYGCEIISMDSMQVYRFMDIGTAKATREEREQVPHHLIDIVDPDDQYDAARFVEDALAAIADITARGNIPLIIGGTGLYLSALVRGLFEEIRIPAQIRDQCRRRLEERGREVLHGELCAIDPESGARVHGNDIQRLLRGLEIFHATGIPWSEHIRRQAAAVPQRRFTRMMQIGLRCDRGPLYQRIDMRTRTMMGPAFREEVEALLARGYSAALPSMQAIGYRHMIDCIQGHWDQATATAALMQDTRRYAKRQCTWFGRSPDIHWYDIHQPATLLADMDLWFNRGESSTH